MFLKKISVILQLIFIILIFYRPSLAIMIKVHAFKDVEIKFNLKHEEKIFEKGKYDFEILFHHVQRVFYLKIRKKGKDLCLIRGEKLKYRNSDGGILTAADLWMDPQVPQDATLRIKRYPGNRVSIIFESGKKTPVYPLRKINFRMEYE